MINYETILSGYDDKLTLMQWLKKVEAALEGASATAFHVNKRGNATITFSIDFADGTQIESGPIVLQQGESVASARISNGHLLLTLSNGDVLDAGVILSGNLNVSGNVTATGTIDAAIITGNEIVEKMSGYFYVAQSPTWGTITKDFAGVCKNGNKLTFAFAGRVSVTVVQGYRNALGFSMPAAISAKLIPFQLGERSYIGCGTLQMFDETSAEGNPIEVGYRITKSSSGSIYLTFNTYGLTAGSTYYFRWENTFILSDSL